MQFQQEYKVFSIVRNIGHLTHPQQTKREETEGVASLPARWYFFPACPKRPPKRFIFCSVFYSLANQLSRLAPLRTLRSGVISSRSLASESDPLGCCGVHNPSLQHFPLCCAMVDDAMDVDSPCVTSVPGMSLSPGACPSMIVHALHHLFCNGITHGGWDI